MTKPHARRWVRALASCFIVIAPLAGLPEAALAQFGPTVATNAPTSAFLPARRELRQSLSNASKAIEEERFAEAAGLLGDMLKETDFEDYFADTGATRSLKEEALKLLRTLPKAGRESYELQFGAEAKKLLNEALESGNAQQLADVVRLYYPTKAGNEAAILWGRRQLDEGHPLGAAVCLQRVIDTSPYAESYEPELSLLAAISWRLAQRPDSATSAVKALQKRMPEAMLSLGGKKLPMLSASDDALAWLDKVIGQQPNMQPPRVSEWAMHRGDNARNAATTGSLPISMFRWHKFLGRDETDDELLARSAKSFQSNNIAAIPTVSPLVVNGMVLTRTPERLMAVDLQSGKFVWRYPWDDLALDEGENVVRSSRIPSANQQRERELAQRVWEDSAYGELTSDGESVYLLDELGYAAMGYSPSTLIMPGGARLRNPGQPSNVNKLVALSLAKQGKLRWTVGGETGMDEPKLAGSFFLGVPLVADKQLYAMVELNGEIRLVVLDPETGKLIWSQQLAHVDTMTITVDSTRRLSGARPSLSEGVLICPTSACSVVAVDLLQRKLLWGYRYLPSTNRQPGNWYGYVQPPRPIGVHWLDSSATIAQGKVLLTPTESDEIICLDLLTGKTAWKPRTRNDDLSDMLYVACVQDDKIVLVGKTRVMALKLADGTPAWNEPLSLAGEMPSGRGFCVDSYYYLPTSTASLLKIDISTGKLAARGSTGRTLGNVVCADEQIVSQSFDGLTTFYQSDALREELVERLKAAPEDPAALAQQGQILLHDGQTEEALAALRKAYALDRTNDDTRSLLVRTLLAALRTDFVKHRGLSPEIEKLLDQPQQRREYLRLQAQGLEKSGELVAAFAAYVGLNELDQGDRPDAQLSSSSMETIEPQLRIRFDRWVLSRLTQLYHSASAEQRTELDTLIAKAFANPPANLTIDYWQRLVRQYGWHPSADEARVELAALRLEAGELLGTEILLAKFGADDDRPLAGRATAILAKTYDKVGRLDFAAQQYQRLATRWPNVPVLGAKTGQQLVDEALGNKDLAKVLKTERDWPGGAIKINEGADLVASGVGYSSYQRIYAVPLVEASGALSRGTALAYDVARSQLTVSDSLGNNVNQFSLLRPDNRRPIAPQTGLAHAHALGHLVLVSLGQEIVVVDTLRRPQDTAESTLWRQDLMPLPSDNSGALRQARPQVVPYPWSVPRNVAVSDADRIIGAIASLSERAVCYAKGRDIICADPLTGETLWERTMPEAGYDLFGDEELLFVVPPPNIKGLNEATVLSVSDGRELGKRPVDQIQTRWQSLGRRVLSCKQEGREFIATMYDAWTQEKLWDAKFAYGSRGTLIGRDEMAMLEPSGDLVIASLAKGGVVLKRKLESEVDHKLMYLYVLRSQDQYLVQCDTIIDAKDAIVGNVQPAPGGEYSKIVSGRLYALARATGEPSWQSPAYISQYGLLLDQPADLPILVYLRHRQPTTKRGNDKQQTSVLVIDRRDGRLILERDNIPIEQTNVYELAGDRQTNTITLSLSSNRSAQTAKTFTFKLTDEPTPPEPPAQTGAASSFISKATASEKLGNIGRAIEKALGTGQQGNGIFPNLFPPGPVPRPNQP